MKVYIPIQNLQKLINMYLERENEFHLNGNKISGKEEGKLDKNMSILLVNCNCKYKCRHYITTSEREALFHTYWQKSYEQQRSFIKKYVKITEKKKKTTENPNSRRNNTLKYFFPRDQEIEIQVCKSTFLQALSITEKNVRYTLEKTSDLTDKRGKSKNSTVSENAKKRIRSHIKQFPTMESHYCRKESRRKYLDKNLNLRQMYRLYVNECKKENVKPQKLWLYENIFNTEFNLGFHHPKKDLCSFCESYKNKTINEKQNDEEYKQHQIRKNAAREQKSSDKDQAIKSNGEVKVLNFDLQNVLISPKCNVGETYYSRKYSTYNFTVFDTVAKKAKCFMWHESCAKRGSCEISSCLWHYNCNLGAVKEVVYYSDSCTGQQRNINFTAMCLYSVVNLPIETITHNYFERGHSQMEEDSVHACIERYSKHRDMFGPSDWINAVRNSKLTKPRYEVKEVLQTEIFDFKSLAQNTISNKRIATDGSVVKWNKIHSFQYRKTDPSNVFFKYAYESDWMSFDIHGMNRRKKVMKSINKYKLSQLYQKKLPISDAKYKDLINLCNLNIIPSIYHEFYLSLPHGQVSTRLPEPDEQEDSE